MLSAAATAAATQAVKNGLDRLFAHRPRREELSHASSSSLAAHLRLVNAWCSRIHIFGMVSPADTRTSTVPMRLGDVPRRFQQVSVATHTLSEHDLLRGSTRYQVVGDPGSGKTTTIKRLVTRVLAESQPSKGDEWAYPVVLVCRDYEWGSKEVNLAQVLGAVIGFDPEAEVGQTPKVPVLALLAQFFDAGPAVVLIDGLDEVRPEFRRQLERDIVILSDYMEASKIVVTSRSGDFAGLDGFSIVELLPLTRPQVAEIAIRWDVDPERFLARVDQHPAADLANRPLFLAHMLILFRFSGGDIPDQPAALYRRIVRLMLQDWDEQRGVIRGSKYADFFVEEKLEFLAGISYYITVVGRHTIRFDSADLIEFYKRLAPQFGLPVREAARVAQELETHTGLVVQIGDRYEFSHLSVQEYLCAYYLVRQQQQDHSPSFINKHPQEFAVASALSSNPSLWLAHLLLRPGVMEREEVVRPFAYRLGKERPRFTEEIELGFAALKLLLCCASEDLSVFEGLTLQANVGRSLSLAMSYYSIAPTSRRHFHMTLGPERPVADHLELPRGGSLPRAAIEMFGLRL